MQSRRKLDETISMLKSSGFELIDKPVLLDSYEEPIQESDLPNCFRIYLSVEFIRK